ncbi:AAA family ATPase [Methylibium sp.]|uniref:bifunctional aminoglycoside phosphotransferase/ATP-binding protein n=1 Tax=Methylibium sp. TaxID=2067992 RepID=UPI003D0974E8
MSSLHPSPGDDLAQALRRRLATDEGAAVELIETHISWVLLTERHAYKIKKPVRFGFVDFTSLEARRQGCEDELRLNLRLAPSLYIGVVEIRGTAEAPRLVGEGPVQEYAVCMHRFPPGALLSERLVAGTLEPAQLDRLAQRLAVFHDEARVVEAGASHGAATTVTRAALGALDGIGQSALATGCGRLRRWLEAQAVMLAPLWAERQARGRVRECHGDLHLANVVVLGDEVTAFDCLEFDETLRCIDVLADIAFLVMDLLAHGRRDLAFHFLNAYLEHTGDYAGLPVLRFYLVYRALVRAQVGLLRRRQGGGAAASGQPAPDYFALARRLATQRDPRLLVTHGLPGSGKSFLSQRLLERVGAIRVRADVERKRLFGLAPLESSRGRAARYVYGEAATARTYARLAHAAQDALRAGYPTIIDAACLRRSERARFVELAGQLGVPFLLLDCEADFDVMRGRIQAREQRGDDASEADVAVLERLSTLREDLSAAERCQALQVDTGRAASIDALAGAWLGRAADETRGAAAGPPA